MSLLWLFKASMCARKLWCTRKLKSVLDEIMRYRDIILFPKPTFLEVFGRATFSPNKVLERILQLSGMWCCFQCTTLFCLHLVPCRNGGANPSLQTFSLWVMFKRDYLGCVLAGDHFGQLSQVHLLLPMHWQLVCTPPTESSIRLKKWYWLKKGHHLFHHAHLANMLCKCINNQLCLFPSLCSTQLHPMC